jgi:Spy/CpxP family protein refolding chaperone
MKKMTFLIVSVIVLLVLNAVTLFILFHMHQAGDRGPHGDNGKGPADYIARQLKLDGPQQQQFEELRNQHHAFARAGEKEDERLHDLYFSMLKTDNPDRSKVDSVATLIGEQRKKLAAATFDHFQKLRAICHDDQKKLFDNTIDEIAKLVTGHPGPPPPER